MYDLTVIVIVTVCAGMVVAAGSRPLQCYWCGPLANQVNKSTRPPPCERSGTTYMICEQQYTHCAVVYSSPPHMESRVCTKTYSEECYTDFCDRTRTWKITCPCKGNMCNVRDVPRERELFDILNNLVDKTFKNFRLKRSNIEHSRSMIAQLGQEHTGQEHEMQKPIQSDLKSPIAKQCHATTLRRMGNLRPTTSPYAWTSHYTDPFTAKKEYKEQLTSTERVYRDYGSVELFNEQNGSATLLDEYANMESLVMTNYVISPLEEHKNKALKLCINVSLALLSAFVTVFNLRIIK